MTTLAKITKLIARDDLKTYWVERLYLLIQTFAWNSHTSVTFYMLGNRLRYFFGRAPEEIDTIAYYDADQDMWDNQLVDIATSLQWKDRQLRINVKGRFLKVDWSEPRASCFG